MFLSVLAAGILKEPSLSEVTFLQLTDFVNLARILRPIISRTQPYYVLTPPPRLPLNVHNFLMVYTGLCHEKGKLVWELFRDLVWDGDVPVGNERKQLWISYMPLFVRHGLSRNLGMFLPSQSNIPLLLTLRYSILFLISPL